MGLFDKSYERAADLICGRTLHAGGRRFTVMRAEGYSKKENEAPLYRPILTMRPGEVYCPRRRNAILVLIACSDGQGRGGCVFIRELRTSTGGVFPGPTAVSQALGIMVPKTTGRVRESPNGDLHLELDAISSGTGSADSDSGQPKAGNGGIGAKTLERLMPEIADAYARDSSGQSFDAFLSDLLARCRTVGALRRALREVR